MSSMIYRIESLPPPPDERYIKNIFGLIDLTSLKLTDHSGHIDSIIEKVNGFQKEYPGLPNVAGICVYPVFLDNLKTVLASKAIDKIVVAGGFPNAHTLLEVKLTEIELLCQQGADEIDVVFPLHYLFSGEEKRAVNELRQIKSITRNKKLKVILEVSLLSEQQIRTACQICFESSVDFIKTSTGKDGSVASLEAAVVICEEIKKNYDSTGQKVGFKPAGGISTYKTAYHYYTVVEEILGELWLNKAFFRIGASSLANDLLASYNLIKQESKPSYF